MVIRARQVATEPQVRKEKQENQERMEKLEPLESTESRVGKVCLALKALQENEVPPVPMVNLAKTENAELMATLDLKGHPDPMERLAPLVTQEPSERWAILVKMLNTAHAPDAADNEPLYSAYSRYLFHAIWSYVALSLRCSC